MSTITTLKFGNNNETTKAIAGIPREVWAYIFSKIPSASIGDIQRVCKTFYEVFKDQNIWKVHFLGMQRAMEPPSDATYKERFIALYVEEKQKRLEAAQVARNIATEASRANRRKNLYKVLFIPTAEALGTSVALKTTANNLILNIGMNIVLYGVVVAANSATDTEEVGERFQATPLQQAVLSWSFGVITGMITKPLSFGYHQTAAAAAAIYGTFQRQQAQQTRQQQIARAPQQNQMHPSNVDSNHLNELGKKVQRLAGGLLGFVWGGVPGAIVGTISVAAAQEYFS